MAPALRLPSRCQPEQAALMLAVLLEQGLGLERTYGPATAMQQVGGHVVHEWTWAIIPASWFCLC